MKKIYLIFFIIASSSGVNSGSSVPPVFKTSSTALTGNDGNLNLSSFISTLKTANLASWIWTTPKDLFINFKGTVL